MAALKQLPTLGVLGTATGIVLSDGGFSSIHEVMDHLYPGIMTIGCAHMAATAAKEIIRQHPSIAELGECGGDNWRDFAARGLAKFGPTMEVSGPHGTGNPDMRDVTAESEVAQ